MLKTIIYFNLLIFKKNLKIYGNRYINRFRTKMDVKQLSAPSMPVVWCSDPNSSTNKPTAFALQGIQLQGNITEKHVIALRDLVNAAAEGRLLLPTDGSIVLSCGIGIGSMIVNENDNELQQDTKQSNDSIASNLSFINQQRNRKDHEKNIINKSDENCLSIENLFDLNYKRKSNQTKDNEPPDLFNLETTSDSNSSKSSLTLNNYDLLYEFLCCAKCMNDGKSGNCFKKNTKIVEQLISDRPSRDCSKNLSLSIASRLIKKSQNRNSRRGRRNSTFSHPKLGRNLKVNTADISPIYATVNKLKKPQQIPAATNLMNYDHCEKINNDVVNKLNKTTEDRYNDLKGMSMRPYLHNLIVKENIEKNSKHLSSLDCNSIDLTTENQRINAVSSSSIVKSRQSSVLAIDDVSVTKTNDFTPTAIDNQSNNSSRKTSFDSSCTLSSMDSGFIEMQNRIDNIVRCDQIFSKQNADYPNEKTEKCKSTGLPPIVVTEAEDLFEETPTICETNDKSGRLCTKECLPQSRNRRKSYEEFKALFNNHSKNIQKNDLQDQYHNASIVPYKEKAKSRRKSYEEFKYLVRDYENSDGKSEKIQTKLSKKLLNLCDPGEITNSTESDDQKKMPSSNDKAIVEEKATASNVNVCGTIYDILQRKISTASSQSTLSSAAGDNQVKDDVYKTNSKIYDKLISYGTIYDIMQKKTDIYNNEYKKYDKYMTYGTIYEIMQRKSEEYEGFQRKRSQSDKFMKRVHQKMHANGKYGSINIGTFYDFVYRKSNEPSLNTMNEKPLNKKYGKIYDIIQTEKSDINDTIEKIRKSRFSINKVTQENDPRCKQQTQDKPNDYCEPNRIAVSPTNKKQNRMRRFSNILSYTPKSSANDGKNSKTNHDPIPAIVENDNVKTTLNETNSIIAETEKSIEELYSDVNKQNSRSEKMIKSNSLDMVISKRNPSDSEIVKIVEMLKNESRRHSSDNRSSHNELANEKQSDKENNEKTVIINNAEKERKISSATRKLFNKKLKSRRLSEFTRGEFLNEKS